MTLPMDGVRIVDLTRLLPGPFCTMLLADFGAEVIKVEEPGAGDYMRWYQPRYRQTSANFASLNRNKRSLALNLKSEEGKEIFRRLVKTADVLVEGFRPGVMTRLGLGYESLRRLKSDLVYCAITGYGQTGPYRDISGHDLNYLSYAGALDLGGDPGGAPSIPFALFGDIAGGAYPAALGIMMALRRRDRTGEGEFLDISLFDGIVSTMYAPVGEFAVTGREWRRGEELTTGGSPRYGVYKTADGKYLSLCPLEDKFWQALFRHIGIAPPDDSTPEEREAAKRLLGRIFLSRTLHQWMEDLAAVDVCVAPVKTVAEAIDDPQVRERGLVLEYDHPAEGLQRILRNPIRTGGREEEAVRRGAPTLGEDTEDVLRELGYEHDAVAGLKAQGVLA